jgi:hypothetical protein
LNEKQAMRDTTHITNAAALTPALSPGARGRSRREFLWSYGGGLGGIALAYMLNKEGLLASQVVDPASQGVLARQGGLHHPPRAQRVVQFYMSGAASQCDMFDYKPLLIKKNGQPWDANAKVELFQSSPGTYMQAPWKWKQYGQSGKFVNDIVAPFGRCVDDMAFIHSMVAKTATHGPATLMQATGFIQSGFPSMGSWVSYGMGSQNDNLPTFVVIPDSRGFAPCGPLNWGSGFLPAVYQGTMIRPTSKEPIADLFPPTGSYVNPGSESQTRALLEKLNREHAETRSDDTRLDARINGYEMAAKLQVSAPEVLDVANEPAHIKSLYGMDNDETKEMGHHCLVARRMLERGVRFVQVWSGADNGFPRRNWDHHEDIEKDMGPMARSMAQPIAAMIQDLKQRGLLEDTIILWTSEFGRMPCAQGSKGRDHNPYGFTNWLAGGGIKGGTTYGASDEFSWKAEDKPTYCYDVHATILHLLGIDHTRLAVRHNGIDRRLTDVHGSVIHELIA